LWLIFKKIMSEHFDFLLKCNEDAEYGFVKWNKWRKNNNITMPELQNSNLSNISLLRYNLDGANLKGSDLSNANLINCDLIDTNLNQTKLVNTNCAFSNFTKATFIDCNLESSQMALANLIETVCIRASFKNASFTHTLLSGSDLRNTDFTGAKIIMSNLVKCNLEKARFENCYLSGSNLTSSNLNKSVIRNTVIFGTSVWNVTTDESIQENLTITNDQDDSVITLDDLEIANFIYLISNNDKISSAIDKISSKVILILGRFTPERLEILNHIKNILKTRNLVPVLFDFSKPKSRDLTETIGLIGRMSKFIIADLTDAKSIPQELSELIPHNPSITIQPILLKGDREYSMFEHWQKYSWVKQIFEYKGKDDLNKLFK